MVVEAVDSERDKARQGQGYSWELWVLRCLIQMPISKIQGRLCHWKAQ